MKKVSIAHLPHDHDKYISINYSRILSVSFDHPKI